MADKVNAGIIGCSAISRAYLKVAPVFETMQITHCADIVMET